MSVLRHCIAVLGVHMYILIYIQHVCVPQMSDLHNGWLLLSVAPNCLLTFSILCGTWKNRIKKKNGNMCSSRSMHTHNPHQVCCQPNNIVLRSLRWMAFLSCRFLVILCVPCVCIIPILPYYHALRTQHSLPPALHSYNNISLEILGRTCQSGNHMQTRADISKGQGKHTKK